MALDREDRRLQRRRRPASEREEDSRQRDLQYLIGVAGLGALAFVLGRATAPGSACCDDLMRSNLALILCAGALDVDTDQSADVELAPWSVAG